MLIHRTAGRRVILLSPRRLPQLRIPGTADMRWREPAWLLLLVAVAGPGLFQPAGAAVRAAEPFKTRMLTAWGAEVRADNAWTEYPRPALVREGWKCLNGAWDYAVTADSETQTPAHWLGQLLVPFALESRLGGVQRLLEATEALWYRRTVSLTPQPGRRVLLNFEAVDYRCDVYVNGEQVGSHQGGFTPFSFDITQAARQGDNEIVVRVTDKTEDWQLRGKQVRKPEGIWYTQVSGIWQTVWLEEVAPTYLVELNVDTDAAAGTITVRPELAGDATGTRLRLQVKDGDRVVAEAQGSAQELAVHVADAQLWSPQSPHLYDLEVALIDGQGQVLDQVQGYAGIRDVGKVRDAAGKWRFTLNGKPLFHWGTLDQGWWPDGLLTPPSDAAMRSDIEFLKAAGFNMIRKHIKVEPRRYYYHCDRLGMLVWQDQVSGGENPPWTRLKPDPVDANWPEAEHAQYMTELERMIDLLEEHPCIVVWVPFNEAWGQHRTLEVGHWVARRDPSRLVNIASGGNFWPVGDVVDAHNYPHPGEDFGDRYPEYIEVIGEFGGHGWPVEGHLWDPDRRNWGYSLAKSKAALLERYGQSIERLNRLRKQGVAAGVYTQTTDVEGEVNGLLTYDRQQAKLSAEELAKLHQVLFNDN
ncbi:MAG: glycoside hydrolase family 2 [Pirellulales bacterium]|nr:glycoside hydrolase family 2 [Pirellulales bacterium]